MVVSPTPLTADHKVGMKPCPRFTEEPESPKTGAAVAEPCSCPEYNQGDRVFEDDLEELRNLFSDNGRVKPSIALSSSVLAARAVTSHPEPPPRPAGGQEMKIAIQRTGNRGSRRTGLVDTAQLPPAGSAAHRGGGGGTQVLSRRRLAAQDHGRRPLSASNHCHKRRTPSPRRVPRSRARPSWHPESVGPVTGFLTNYPQSNRWRRAGRS